MVVEPELQQPVPAVVPGLYPWLAPVYIDLTDEDNGDGH